MRKVFLSLSMIIFLSVSPSVFAQPDAGGGGEGVSMAVMVPVYHLMPEDKAQLPVMVQEALIAAIERYSAISVMEGAALEKLLEENPVPDPRLHLTVENFGETLRRLGEGSLEETINRIMEERIWLGQVTQCDYVLSGTILDWGDVGYLFSFGIHDTEGRSHANYFKLHPVAPVEDLSAVRAIAIELLLEMGAPLTEAGDREWRKGWVARLLEFELDYKRHIGTFLSSFGLGNSNSTWAVAVDRGTNTASVTFQVDVFTHGSWFEGINGEYRALKEALDATGRAEAWGLDWPAYSITGEPLAFPAVDYVRVDCMLYNGIKEGLSYTKNESIAMQSLLVPLRVRSALPDALVRPMAGESPVLLTFTDVALERMTGEMFIEFAHGAFSYSVQSLR